MGLESAPKLEDLVRSPGYAPDSKLNEPPLHTLEFGEPAPEMPGMAKITVVLRGKTVDYARRTKDLLQESSPQVYYAKQMTLLAKRFILHTLGFSENPDDPDARTVQMTPQILSRDTYGQMREAFAAAYGTYLEGIRRVHFAGYTLPQLTEIVFANSWGAINVYVTGFDKLSTGGTGAAGGMKALDRPKEGWRKKAGEHATGL